MCNPKVGARFLGFGIQVGWLTGSRDGFQLAGFVNRPAKLIGIAPDLKPKTKWFTLAHEVGHLVMHPGLHEHREIPLDGMTEPHVPADPKERQANDFAGCYLVPRRQLREAFLARFRVESLKLNDNVAWELLGDDWPSLMNAPYPSEAFERVVAQAGRFRGGSFKPLDELFLVSATTMAIRLRQCGLVYR